MKVAVVGAGFIGPVHIEALCMAGQEVVGWLSASAQKTRSLAQEFGIPRVYDNLDQLLGDPAVEAVHVTSPNRHHYEQCRQAIAAGKHIVCEKPLAMNEKESGELVALASSKPLAAAVCYNIRFYPICLEMHARIAAGELGEIYHISGSYQQDWLLYKTDFNWRVLAEEGGRVRAAADIGTHWLDLAQFVGGLPVAEVCADLFTVHPHRYGFGESMKTFQGKLGPPQDKEPIAITTEDHASILLRFGTSVGGALIVSQVAAGRKNCLRLEIAGAKGSLAWNSERPNELWLGHRDRPNELLIRDPALLAKQVRPFTSYPGGHNEGFPDTFKQLFRAIYGYVERGDFSSQPPFPTFADGHREVVLCEAIRKSHLERRWIHVK